MFVTSGFRVRLRALRALKIVSKSISKRFQILSEAILEAYASLNSTSGPFWARFGLQNPSQNRVQKWSKIDLEGYPRPKPPPMAIFEPSETSPRSFSTPLRARFCVSYNQTKNVSELLASSCGRHHADYRTSSQCHRRGSSLESSFAIVALRQNILEAQIPALSVRILFGQRFLFG